MLTVSDLDILELEAMANTIRQDIIRMLVSAGSGHAGGPLGMAEVFTALYFRVMRHNPDNPDWEERDRLVLSNGHICAVRYAAMARSGYFPVDELLTYRKIDSRLQGHPHNLSLPGLENTGGPLGQGLSQAIGRCLAARMDDKDYRVYCAMSDGEHDEGQTWEALMFAGNHKLRNLTTLLDRNNIQIDGHTEDIFPLEPLRAKYEAVKWHVIEIDGHNIRQIIEACGEAKAVYEKPTAIICHTIPGKGVDYMENEPEWHGKAPSAEMGERALEQLHAEGERIRNGIAKLRG
ncbi:MAG: transketolase [Candidatus Aquicultor sp.]|nr:transketolase [Candidatus Aquicultor sp.]